MQITSRRPAASAHPKSAAPKDWKSDVKSTGSGYDWSDGSHVSSFRFSRA